MASFNVSDLPNPFTPLAFLPPDNAHQVQVEEYVLVGTAGAFVWEILSSLYSDYRLVAKCRVGLPTYTYLFARLWSFLFVFSSAFFQTYPFKNCVLGQHLVGVTIAVAVPANAFLFFLRARAIYDQNPFFVAFLAISWVGVAVSSAMVPAGINGGNIGPTNYCRAVSTKPFISAVTIAPLFNDTIIFVAISWRLYRNSHVDRSFRNFVTGESLPRFSKALLQDGQLYYLVPISITVACNLLAMIMFYNPHVAVPYQTMFTVPNVMVTNAMASHVYRKTKLGYHERIVTSSELNFQSQKASGCTLPMRSLSGPRARHQINAEGLKNGVHVTNITELTRDPSDSECFPQFKIESRV
ncbi:hypothetical protein K438DRAFT_1904628 [Mycena galopus ATCC 62051]|nr:hypothetical protein K438DRAFT_1904628 [Mycena galopus ATCC 62051]